MLNFNYYVPTKVLFGEGQVDELANMIKQFNCKILLVYGEGNIKRIGLYE